MAIHNVDTNKGVWVLVEGSPGGGFVVVDKDPTASAIFIMSLNCNSKCNTL